MLGINIRKRKSIRRLCDEHPHKLTIRNLPIPQTRCLSSVGLERKFNPNKHIGSPDMSKEWMVRPSTLGEHPQIGSNNGLPIPETRCLLSVGLERNSNPNKYIQSPNMITECMLRPSTFGKHKSAQIMNHLFQTSETFIRRSKERS